MRSTRRETAHPFMTKPGRHGTLYRFKIRYTDPHDGGIGVLDWFTWAYDFDHAEERFFESDEGWKLLSVDKVRDTTRMRDRPRRRAS